MRDSRERLLGMLDAIKRMERYSVRGGHAFEDDESRTAMPLPGPPHRSLTRWPYLSAKFHR